MRVGGMIFKPYDSGNPILLLPVLLYQGTGTAQWDGRAASPELIFNGKITI